VHREYVLLASVSGGYFFDLPGPTWPLFRRRNPPPPKWSYACLTSLGFRSSHQRHTANRPKWGVIASVVQTRLSALERSWQFVLDGSLKVGLDAPPIRALIQKFLVLCPDP